MQKPLRRPEENTRERRMHPAAAVLLLAGLVLRIYFQRRWAFVATDSLLYQDIAQNWLRNHIYGLSTGMPPRPTLIRLPGYPAMLAGLAWMFDRWMHAPAGSLRSFLPVLWLQIFADLGTCWLASSIARRLFGVRAGLVALGLACLCPFTAQYTAVPLTETLTLFFLVLTFHTLCRWCDRPSPGRVVLLSVALGAGVMLRPDQGLLVVSALAGLYLCAGGNAAVTRLRQVVLCALLVAVPFAPWTLRNWHTFHVVQPLAPKQAVDPGEGAPLGFERWFRTWAVDFSANDDAYWNYPDGPVLVDNLPERAFDSLAERARTASLFRRAAAARVLDPGIESDLQALADDRIRAHPVRYYVLLPVARLLNMLFHPRVEMLPGNERWWQYRGQIGPTLLALLYGALNLALFVAAVAGMPAALRANRALSWGMISYIVLRCGLLLTLDNAEQRYTLEFIPVFIIFAAPVISRCVPLYRRSLDAIQNC